ncbi:MAG: DUF1992 domain-containing protein [Caldilineales bacterium]|nr:DUF1992 domain-containing protein [Caldilineales bacterium]
MNDAQPEPTPERAHRKPQEQTWDNWVEQLIQEAMQRGDFDNLPGAGKPLPNRRNPYLADDRQLAYDLVQNSGHTLPWIGDAQEIDSRTEAARQRLRQQHDSYRQQLAATPAQSASLTAAWEQNCQTFAQELSEINRLIDNYNLKAPSPRLHKLRLILAEELARLP